jgi:hypothetical protein
MAAKKKVGRTARPGLPADYAAVLESLKRRVREAQTRAVLSVNRRVLSRLSLRRICRTGRATIDRQPWASALRLMLCEKSVLSRSERRLWERIDE